MDILEKTLDYLSNEFTDYRHFIARQTAAPSIPSRKDELALIDRNLKTTLDRGMGVVMFVQSLGVAYDDIKAPYEEFKDALYKMTWKAKETIGNVL